MHKPTFAEGVIVITELPLVTQSYGLTTPTQARHSSPLAAEHLGHGQLRGGPHLLWDHSDSPNPARNHRDQRGCIYRGTTKDKRETEYVNMPLQELDLMRAAHVK